MTQVFPQSIGFRLVEEANDIARTQNIMEVSPVMLGGFAAAKILVEALRRSRLKPTRNRLQAALGGMQKFDLGVFELIYTLTDHSGLDFADLSIITVDGKFRRWVKGAKPETLIGFIPKKPLAAIFAAGNME